MAIEVTGLSQGYKGREVLKIHRLSLHGRVGLVGINGSGKTTLLNTLAGALPPMTGDVHLAGSSAYSPRERKTALRTCALMPQGASMPRGLTALQMVSYFAWLRGSSWRQVSEKAHDALAVVDLATQARQQVTSLSGGMQRRVLLAQAIVNQPEILLLDEPSTGLDPQQRRRMLDLLNAMTASTVVLSSHVMEDVIDVAESVVVLHEGDIVFQGSTAQLLDHAQDPTSPRAAEDAFLRIIQT